MTPSELPVQIDRVATLERELADAKRVAAKSLRAARESLGLSLRAVRPKARRSIATLSQLETGGTWETKLALRLARMYGQAEAEQVA
jgi:predicted transcriptional regulator